MAFFAFFCFLALVSVVRSDLYGCSQETSCKTCIKHNPCGWCETNIVYEDGSMGPQCAGKPQDPKNPPKDYKPWTCPSSFQNLFCPSYLCSNKTYQCVSTMNGDGKPLDECFSSCLPPVYSCNKTDAKCYLSVPGIGVDKTSCEKSCVDALYTCDKTHYQCVAVKTGGKPFSSCQAECFPPTYDCNETNKTCYQVKPGQGTDLNSCKATCGKSLAPSKQSPTAPTQQSFYDCNETDFTCVKVKHGQSLSACQAVCGNPSNVTPTNLIGNYRGLQVNSNFLKGEWTMQITEVVTVIKDPTGKVWAQGTVATYGSELWLVTSKGNYRGIDSQNTLPEVFTLTWAMGPLAGTVPRTFDDAMKKGFVFTMKKCLSPANCKWLLSKEKSNSDAIFHARTAHKHHKRGPVNDPCSAYPDCQTCINAKDYCGWCSVNVFYNATIPGTQCAGLNQTKVPGFLCPGAFSTVDCPTIEPPSAPPTTEPPTSIPPLRPTAPVMPPPPTAPVVLYFCNPATSKCEQNSTGSGGMPLDQCNLTCNVIPDVPVILRGRKFRGLQIQSGYMFGEYTVAFNTTTAVFVNPKGITVPFIVSQTGQYMVLNLPNGQKIYTLWQIGEDAVVDFLSWSWGATGGAPPTSFDTSMVTSGQTSYVFDGCSALSEVCFFGLP